MRKSSLLILFSILLVLLFVYLFGSFQRDFSEPEHTGITAKDALKIATWNIEHLAEHNGEGCRPRYDEDYRELKEYAKNLDADIVALQEVESAKAVARVFPDKDWNIELSQRPPGKPYECRENGNPSTQQKVAIAVRKGVEFDREDDFRELGMELDGLRYGVMIRFELIPEPIYIMAVHLKSGCFVDDYTFSDTRDCEIFEKQTYLLDQWVESKLRQNQPFILLGDFNHRISNPDNRFRKQLSEMDHQPVFIKNSMETLAGCHPEYPEPIDHILFGPGSADWYKPGSETVHFFGNNSGPVAEEEMLSDHCAVSAEINIAFGI